MRQELLRVFGGTAMRCQPEFDQPDTRMWIACEAEDAKQTTGCQQLTHIYRGFQNVGRENLRFKTLPSLRGSWNG